MNALRVALGISTIILHLPAIGQAQQLAAAPPNEVGMSARRLAEIDALVNRRVTAGESIGVSVLVSRRGAVVYFKQFGLMDAEAGKPMQPDTIVRIYSMTKAITSAAALMLYDEGKVALDDPVEKFLPELARRTVYNPAGNRPATTTLTVRHLLLHTSGFIYGQDGGTAIQQQYADADLLNKDGTLQDLVDKLARLPLAFDPGTDWEYGVSTDVLGALVQRVSGQTLEEFFRERIFVPLKMVDTAFEVPTNKLGRFAACYERRGQEWRLQDAPATSRYARPATMYSGGGGLVSTAPDYWRFLMMIANGGNAGGTRLLKSKTVQLMTSNQLDDRTGWIADPGQGYGLGFRVLVEPIPLADRRLLTEYGWAGRASTVYWTNPREEITVVVLEQLLPFTDRNFVDVQSHVYEAIEAASE
jgi:CubicO group peptidase (beta-lactamase class C family)